MKMPKIPPSTGQLIGKNGADRFQDILNFNAILAHGKYVHWDKLIRYPAPDRLNHEEWWMTLKMGRQPLFKAVPLKDKDGQPFKFLITDPIPEQLHLIDLGAGGQIGVPEPITNPETRNQYYVSSLIEEATASSQLEGATTTREVAKAMLRDKRPPSDKSERMILNNYLTMQRISDLKARQLTPALIFELHAIVTEGTLDDVSCAGRFRREDEAVRVESLEGEIFHVPPAANELPERMAQMCAFANGQSPDYFLHPVIRSIMLHFWLAYDHPFVDGNGRTARALFYWSMLHYGFWLCEYISISRIILKAPAQYGRAFLYTETDDNDLTYFILHQIEVLRRAMEELHHYTKTRVARLQDMERELRGMVLLNHRQRALLSHALRHPHHVYSVEGHRLSHNVVYETARHDLLSLVKRGLFEAQKAGKTWRFRAAPNVEARLAQMG